MRRAGLMLLIVMALLTGCAAVGSVEDQAYALVLGVEDAPGGGIRLTIRIPRIGSSGPDAQAGKGEPYLVLSAAGDSYGQALEQLQWAAARELNLSHLKLIVVSEALAASEAFPALIRQIAETRHLYTTAGFIVCPGGAKDFIEGQQTIQGTRLSSEISAMFRHHARHGYIPWATFADLYYATLSGLSDPTGILGFAAGEEGLPEAQTASERQYLGAAVFRDGRLAAQLDARDTLWLNLLTTRLDSFTYTFAGKDYALSCAKKPRRTVAFDGDGVRLGATLWLSSEDSATDDELEAVARDLSAALTDMIRRCQAMGLEPFGFAERAAAHFLTIGEWRAFDWRGRFPSAQVEVKVNILGSGG